MRILLFFLLPLSVMGQIEPVTSTTNLYLEQLTVLKSNRPIVVLPDKKYFLFGMNKRKRLIYENGSLIDLNNGQKIKSWYVRKDTILPEQYAVELETIDGRKVRIEENEKEIFYDDSRFKISLSEHPVYFPSFNNKKFEYVLKVLYQEILLNINEDKIYTNFQTQKPASYKDIALLAMALDKTSNSALLLPYLKTLKLPAVSLLDAQETGALLYLFSLKGSANQIEVGQLINFSKTKDFQKNNTAIDQLKWLKFGLKRFELEDHLNFNNVQNKLVSTFWLDFIPNYFPSDQEIKKSFENFTISETWGAEHLYKKTLAPINNQTYPLTWLNKNDSIQAPNLSLALEMFLTLYEY